MSAILHVFGDESGIEDTAEYCIIAGYIGAPRQWEKFRRSWAKVLRKYGVPEFHARDFYQPERRKRVPHYQGWTDDKASAFLAALLKIISERNISPLSSALHVPSFDAFDHDERRYLTGGLMKTRVSHVLGSGEAQFSGEFISSGAPSRPYLVVFQQFIGQALGKAPDGTQVHFTFDLQNVVQPRAPQTFHEQFRGGHLPPSVEAKAASITYADSVLEEALQAADMYAYFWNRALKEGIHGRLLDQTREAVARKMHRMSVFKREHLQGVLDKTVDDAIAQIKRSGLW